MRPTEKKVVAILSLRGKRNGVANLRGKNDRHDSIFPESR